MSRQRSVEMLEETPEAKRVRSRVVLSADEFSCELVQHVKRFVRQSRTTNHANCIATMFFCDCIEPFGDVTNCLIPGCGNQLAAFLVTDHRRANTRLMINERMSETTFDAKELAIDSVDVTIARD